MSRFHHEKSYHARSTLKRNLVILIDEGDAAFHPEWQRQFFSKSMDFLCQLFKEHKLQIIYTSNAPFITSDLTKSHILFIEKIQGKSVVHEKTNDRMETFGSNIHSLFSDAFYMEGVLMGAFAEKKINAIISFLRNRNRTKPVENIRRNIDLIGEPIMRSKLQEMWYEKFGDIEKIEWHKQQIQKIEKERQKGNGKSGKNNT